ncbi:hypothetical protein [Mesorhizobium sp. B2-3-4]|uniref:hypothetical protein n=1 Tax=Mesorhizobium sp. B2-3-4 TaxID=2589959 RepID=UPI00112956F2|nr:hypothetical protein [Mesorhizobium sp. B2-3-4]TPM41425.1 hypothetical protein FJ967_00360 [Mesorhizobium sp. B2-3-4]
MKPKHDWHLDLRITLGLILSTAMNIAGGVWWAAKVQNVNDQQDTAIARLETRQDRADASSVSQIERLARIEANQANQTQLLQEIRQKAFR